MAATRTMIDTNIDMDILLHVHTKIHTQRHTTTGKFNIVRHRHRQKQRDDKRQTPRHTDTAFKTPCHTDTPHMQIHILIDPQRKRHTHNPMNTNTTNSHTQHTARTQPTDTNNTHNHHHHPATQRQPQRGPKCTGLWHTNQQSWPQHLSCYSMLTG